MHSHSHDSVDKKRLIYSAWFPLVFITILILVKTYEVTTLTSLSKYGLYPLNAKGLLGIITSPLLHSNWQHLANNAVPLFVLLWTLYYFFKDIALHVFALTWFMNGFWLWFFGRESYHIGASGLVYGFAAFLFVSGIIKRNRNLLAIAMLVAFLYGSMIWGIFPMEENISWESHLTGLLAGIVLAIYYKKHGPQANLIRPRELEDEPYEGEEYWIIPDDEESEKFE